MGSNAALMCARVIDNTFDVLSVQLLALLEAIDCLGKAENLSPKPKYFYSELRKVCGKIEEDLPKFRDLAAIKTYLKENNPEVI
jgi:histidine ammonia-lyase